MKIHGVKKATNVSYSINLVIGDKELDELYNAIHGNSIDVYSMRVEYHFSRFAIALLNELDRLSDYRNKKYSYENINTKNLTYHKP
jgi:hypothetical protein